MRLRFIIFFSLKVTPVKIYFAEIPSLENVFHGLEKRWMDSGFM